jgi:hypothetical protein
MLSRANILKNSDKPKDPDPRVFPDIVIHSRGTDRCNLVVIEIKMSNSNQSQDIDEQNFFHLQVVSTLIRLEFF